ncbi:hypothetical protein [Terriglobus albidus]|nr:hypothetical protein [Terriglobus albidus]
MPKWRVEFYGDVEVEADSEIEAEIYASDKFRPGQHCRAELIEGEVEPE